MHSKFLLQILFICFTTYSFAQTFVGNKLDVDGTPYNGYFDESFYNPMHKVEINSKSSIYHKGRCITKGGEILSGPIAFNYSNIVIIQEGEYVQYNPEDLQSFVIQQDSFIVADIRKEHKKRPKWAFVKYIMPTKNGDLVKHYHKLVSKESAIKDMLFVDNNNGFGSKKDEYNETYTYYTKNNNESYWYKFTNDKDFKKNALKYLSTSDLIAYKIEKLHYNYGTLNALVDEMRYDNYYRNNSFLFFNAYWQEVKNKSEAVYYAQITKSDHKTYITSYFKDNKVLFRTDYDVLYPTNMNGSCYFYHENGKVRKHLLFIKGTARLVEHFNLEGELQQKFTYKKYLEIYKDNRSRMFYLNVGSDSAKILPKVLDQEFHHTLTNAIDKKHIHQTYVNNRLERSCYFNGTDSIYQNTNIYYLFNTKKVKNAYQSFCRKANTLAYPKDAKEQQVNGYVLVTLMINEKGYIQKAKRLNSLSPSIDSNIDEFLKSSLQGEKGELKFASFKWLKQKKNLEVVVPFHFNVDPIFKDIRKKKFQYQYQQHFDQNLQHHIHNMNVPVSPF